MKLTYLFGWLLFYHIAQILRNKSNVNLKVGSTHKTLLYFSCEFYEILVIITTETDYSY